MQKVFLMMEMNFYPLEAARKWNANANFRIWERKHGICYPSFADLLYKQAALLLIGCLYAFVGMWIVQATVHLVTLVF